MIAIGIIPDGNRRYAREHGLKPWEGHRRGAELLKRVMMHLYERDDIHSVAVYVFSYNNFRRSRQEVLELMKIFYEYFREILKDITKNGARATIEFIGDYDRFPKRVCRLFDKIKRISGGLEKRVYFVVNYIPGVSSAPDLKIDLLIRTGNERRISGFLPYNVAESELVFRKEMWPEYSVRKMRNDINKFYSTERRMGA